MTDLRKAAEMALEALETLWDILDDIDTASDMAKENDAWYRKRVEALQKKRWDTMITTDGYKLKGGPVEALRQALAEPVMYIDGKRLAQGMPDWKPGMVFKKPKREWVGLTENEAKQLYEDSVTEWQFAQAIEAKLKEKNCG